MAEGVGGSRRARSFRDTLHAWRRAAWSFSDEAAGGRRRPSLVDKRSSNGQHCFRGNGNVHPRETEGA